MSEDGTAHSRAVSGVASLAVGQRLRISFLVHELKNVRLRRISMWIKHQEIKSLFQNCRGRACPCPCLSCCFSSYKNGQGQALPLHLFQDEAPPTQDTERAPNKT